MSEMSVLEAPVPAHWGRLQRWKNNIIYIVVRASFAIFRLVPFGISRLCAIALGHLAALVDVKDYNRAKRQAQAAMPELTPAKARRIARRMFVHLAVSAVEVIHTPRFMRGKHAIPLLPPVRKILDDALAEGRGVVLVTGHIGNWELCGQALACNGFPIASIAKQVYDPRLTRFVHALRTAYGNRILWRKDPNVVKEILRIFKDNQILGILIDQDTRVQGAFVPFFGKPAHTPTAAASFAIRAQAAVVVIYGHRIDGRHELFGERCPYALTGDHETDVLALTTELSRRLESAIRRQPEQWVWMHERWKKQPPAVDSKPAALHDTPEDAAPQRSPAS